MHLGTDALNEGVRTGQLHGVVRSADVQGSMIPAIAQTMTACSDGLGAAPDLLYSTACRCLRDGGNMPGLRVDQSAETATAPLPLHFALSSFWPQSGPLPQHLFISQGGCLLDGLDLPRTQQALLGGGIQVPGRPVGPNPADVADAALSVSWFLGGPGDNRLGSFELSDDHQHALGILGARAADGSYTLAFCTGQLVQEPAPQATSRDPDLPPPALDVHELLSMKFVAIDSIVCDMLSDNLSWALDASWRTRLVAPARPQLADRLVPIADAGAEFYNALMAPAVIGSSLWTAAQPGAGSPLPLSQRLTPQEAAALDKVLHQDLGQSASFQRQVAALGPQAYLRSNTRLALFGPAHAAALYGLLSEAGPTQDQGPKRPSIIAFLAAAVQTEDYRSPALRFLKRYTAVLTALDESGALADRLRSDLIAAVLMQIAPSVRLDDAAALADALHGTFDAALASTATDPVTISLRQWITEALSTFKTTVGLALQIAALVSERAQGQPRTTAGLLRLSGAAADAFNLKYPAVPLLANTLYSLLFGYGVYLAVCGFLDWDALTAEKRAALILSTALTVKGGLTNIMAVVHGVSTLLKGDDAAAAGAVEGGLAVAADQDQLLGRIAATLAQVEPRFAQVASAWISTALRVKDFACKMATWFDRCGMIVRALGPITALVSLAQAVYGLIGDLRGGAPPAQIAIDSFNVALDVAIIVCVTVDLVLDLLAATVVGVVLAAIGMVVTMLVPLFYHPSQPPSAADEYMAQVVKPFLSRNGSPTRATVERLADRTGRLGVEVRTVYFRGQALGAG